MHLVLPFLPTLKRLSSTPSVLFGLHAALLYTPVWSTTALKNESIGIILYFGKNQYFGKSGLAANWPGLCAIYGDFLFSIWSALFF